MPSQKELDKFFIETAQRISEFSKCQRLKVGAVITSNNRIVSCGYNGSPSGFINCNDPCACGGMTFNWDNSAGALHHLFSEQFEIHAEMNAILDMAKRGLSPEGCTLYTTICPCKNCAKLVIASGIKRIVFNDYYYRDVECKNLDNKEVNEIIFQELNGADIIKLLGPREIEIEKFS